MTVEDIMIHIMNKYTHLARNVNWGERGLFYNPGNRLPLGAYMMTFKERDGKNDSASRINRQPGLFRLNLKISKETFIKLFDGVPSRPAAGHTVATGHDFTKLDTIMPHPVYGWMTWIAVINPSAKTIAEMESLNLFDEAYRAAVETFNKKTGTKNSSSLLAEFSSLKSSSKKRRKEVAEIEDVEQSDNTCKTSKI